MTIDDKYREMTETPVRRLVVRLAVPTMLSMMVTSFYNVVDAAFVGHLSTEATAGIGVAFAYMLLVNALGFFFGHGSGNYISRELGARRRDTAARMASVGFFTPFLISVALVVVMLPNLAGLARLLGGTPAVVPYAVDYLRFIVAATPFMMTSLTLNNQLRLQGNARLGTIGLVSGAILNIGLDAVFIVGLGMGVSGASLATAVSQFVCWMLLLWGTSRRESVPVRLRGFRPSARVYREILMGGFPSLCRQVFNCVSVICLNYVAARYAAPGEEASVVAAFTVVSRTMTFAYSFMLGVNQGFQPVAGFNYGARLFGRVLGAYRFAMVFSSVLLSLVAAVIYVFAPQIVCSYRAEDCVMVAVGIRVLRYQCVTFGLVAVPVTTNMLFQVIRMPVRSALLSVGRQGTFFISALLVLPCFLGLQGVMLAQPVADVATFLFGVPFIVWIVRKLRNNME